MPDSGPRRNAWTTGSRASPTFSPAMNSGRLPNGPPPSQQQPKDTGSFPPLNQQNGARPQETDRILQSLTGLIGTTVTISTKRGQKYEGVVNSTSGEGDTTGVALKDVKEISVPGAPLKDSLFIASADIDTWASGPADARAVNGDSFKTDSDISSKPGPRRERELAAWSSDSPNPASTVTFGTHGDDVTFGPGASNGSWDQFATNEKLFGVKTSFDEEVYTTKLDRTVPDFKERERKAQQIANEIMGSATNNAHIREERIMDNPDENGTNEEDKYAGVVRGANAYIPPGARKTGAIEEAPKPDIPKVSINGPDGATPTTQAAISNGTTPAPAISTGDAVVPAFRDFVSGEKQRLAQKKQAVFRAERDKWTADFVKFSQTFKLKKPIPDDLVPILTKDEEKQKQIREKTKSDAVSENARAIGQTTTPLSTSSNSPQQPVPAVKTTTNPPPPKPAQSTSAKPTSKPDASIKRPNMFIQAIPPFKGKSSNPLPADGNASAAVNRLNVTASPFKPNPQAIAFTPSVSPATTTGPSAANQSPKPKPTESAKPNPFFGIPIKKTAVLHIKDDFNPFKYAKVAEPSAIATMWPYSGKRYSHNLPAQPPAAQQQSPHLAPPVPPPIPPPSYEEDSAQQAAQSRNYVYAYPQYYPGQPMMPGMAPPPPGSYMPSPYMHPIHYPHTMPPPNAMYPSPSMGQMPPPGPYMAPPPPPGAYPPPPNGGGPRPSMPPTPIPAHAHPYYSQSPQLQPAVPYQMMMPPGQHVPHPYEGAPAPVQMGGVGHA